MHYIRGGALLILQTNSSKPIYIQIAEWLETEILNGNFKEDDKVYSQYQLAEMFTINPATAAKGLTLLTDENILYGKRGLGKFVTADAKAIIIDKRKNYKLKGLLEEVALEADQLGVGDEEIIAMLKKAILKQKGD